MIATTRAFRGLVLLLRRNAPFGFLAIIACNLLTDQNKVPLDPPAFSELTETSDFLVAVAAGDIAGCNSFYKDEATAALVQQEPTAIALALGDLAYADGSVAEFGCYNASWGQFKDRTYPTPGNHDYHQPGATPYFDYFNGAGVDSGRAGHRARGRYAFDYGTWRIIVLNSEVDIASQTTWLKAELAANPRACTIAMWHRPYYSSNNSNPPSVLKPWWDAILAGRVEIALQASHHYYERFAPQNSLSGATSNGVRAFVVGTGGAGVSTPDIVPKVNSEKLILRTHGILVLRLFADKYAYEFRGIDGTTLDAGEGPCIPGQAIPPPSSSTIQLAVATREDATTQYMTLTWSGANGTLVDVYRNGALIKTTDNDGHYTNSRASKGTITYVYKLCEAGTSTCSNEASASFGQPPPNAPPAATFASACTGLSCSFTDGSTDSDGRVTAWSWNFGDGGASTAINPNHTYAAGGPYEVILTVTDDDGATALYNQAISVEPAPNQPPSAAFEVSCTGFTCSLTDQSTDDQGNLTLWSWTFGDGETATTQNPAHTYAEEGTYEVTLTVTDQEGETGSLARSVTVTTPPPNMPPSAAFDFSCTGLTCSFTDRSSDDQGNLTQWSWTFGDGQSATTQSPAHTYADAGSFDVTLTVTDNNGETGTQTQSVTASEPPNAPPSAGFAFSCTGLTCSFTDQSTDADGTIASWSWTFGNGGTATAPNPNHTYAAAGTYTVTLTATDDDGANGGMSKQVSVSAPASIVLQVTGRTEGTTQYMTLSWTGASGAMVDVYRNGTKIKTTENDGHYTNSRSFVGAVTYTYRVCQAGTTICSNNAAVTFK